MILTHEDLGHSIVLTYGNRRLDGAWAEEFRVAARECIRSDCNIYLLDLSAVTFVDSSGIGAVVGLLKHLGRERRLELCSLSPMVRKVFRLTRLDKIFIIRKDREAFLQFYQTPIRVVS